MPKIISFTRFCEDHGISEYPPADTFGNEDWTASTNFLYDVYKEKIAAGVLVRPEEYIAATKQRTEPNKINRLTEEFRRMYD
jgi:hypothetical protein